INVLSLLGLVLAIGIVVDDAIVVVEAVQVNIEKGMTPKEATKAAMQEVTAPIVATTLVLVAVFIPVAVMGGITGRLYQQFAITVAVSVVFSSINALSLSPALCGLLLRKQKPIRGPLGAFFRLFNKVFDKTTDAYTGFTKIVTRRIAIGIVFIIVLTVGLGFLGKLLPGGFMPNEDMGYLMVNIQLPDAASLQRSDAVTKKVEKIIQKYEEVEYVTAATGFSMISGSMSSNAAFVFVSLKDWNVREKTANDVVAALNREFFMGVNEAQVFAFGPPAIPGLGSGSGFTMMVQDRVGNTPEYLAKQTDSFIQTALARPEIGSMFTTFRATVPQRYMEINRDKVLKAGVSLNDIYTTVGAFLGGSYVNDFNRFGRLYKAYIQAEPEYRINEDKINLFFVKNKDGDRVPLSAFVSIKEIAGPDFTTRFNLYRAIELTGGPAPGYTSAQALDALEAVAKESLPADMGYAWSNMSFQEKKASGTGAIVFVFSLLFVFLILAAQYESWSLPFSILLGTPFAIFGAFLALFLARMTSPSYELNVFAQVALVMLIAMAAKNAILIVEFANIEFNKGLSLFDAAIKAARLRFRPILMTAFSFILGVMPLVVASGAGAEARVVMGVALLGGMTLATILGVFFYPMLFVFIGKWALFDDPMLHSLVSMALENNRDLKIAVSRIEQARATVGFTRADQYPHIDVEAGIQTGNFSGGSRSPDTNSTVYLAAPLSWEIDFWGKFKRSTEAARAELMASEYGLNVIQLALIADVVTTYYQLLDFHQRLAISESTLDSRMGSLKIIQQRFDKGIIAELDVNQAQIQKEIAAAAIPLYERSISKTENGLSILLGRLPAAIKTRKNLAGQPTPPEIPVGMPSDILERRPDIIQARYLLKAQTENIGVAEALRLPAISLTGTLGVASTEIASITTQGGVWSVGGRLLGPIFDFNKNKRRVEIEEQKMQQVLYQYENTVLTAFREVEDALVEIATYR
ncbi:MAG: efflux transporter outer membrane subunit, partial [Desulfosarcina sp.]|nr:efflux transporter outer membrane subunit [Desulfosarcina sp.]MBC2768269.1 efflux transporter outer membrane subunit [Desulfosarcina sp.]